MSKLDKINTRDIKIRKSWGKVNPATKIEASRKRGLIDEIEDQEWKDALCELEDGQNE